MFAITGATGNTGSVVAEKLLAQKEKVRVIGRDAGRLARFVQKGAEAFVADITDAAALAKAFSGATAVYAMVPPDMASPDPRGYQEKATDALALALGQARVTHAVVLSSVGADKPAKTGPVVGLHNLEQKLNAVAGLNAVYLRAGYFMENLLPQVDVIKNFGMVGGPLRPDLRVGMIATRDIGAAAAEILKKGNFTGKHSRELLGQRDIDYREAALVIGKAIGKPNLTYSQLPAEQLKPALTQMGMSPKMAALLLEMAESLNSGYMVALEPRSKENTTPTSIETFVTEVFAPRFQGKSAKA
ncbi:MAG TPA: NmrA family NAD(P)-binding protein [Terriglobia bacterium]|nr:NmrA family NAD(P)-binding protein [Terriglobia bacterium]